MVATVLKNNLEEQKEDLREMGMQIMKGAEKAG